MGKRVEAVVYHCSACGAPLAEGVRSCSHCKSPITKRSLDLDRVCVECGHRLSSKARYCNGCGVAVPEQSITPLPDRAACPRCKGTLQQRDLRRAQGGGTLVECAHCGGLWLSPALFDHFCRRAEAAGVAHKALGRARRPTRSNEDGVVRYLACPDCAQRMNRRNFGGAAGVIVDVCAKHGLWFDHEELAQLLGFLRDGGRDAIERAEAVAARERVRRTPCAGRGGGAGADELGLEFGPQAWVAFLIELLRELRRLWFDREESSSRRGNDVEASKLRGRRQ
ncbi:MAG: hypothetical protein EXS13_01290 [Planctomycetes bacterium]|nr:hypothetical protein [Planctomycetota bacterium]